MCSSVESLLPTSAGAPSPVRLCGGAGYLAGAGIEAQLRDSVPATIFSGTTVIQKVLIARETGL